jgi:DNA gyrase subunit A
VIRLPIHDVSVLGRNTQGVRLIRLDDGERLIGVEPVEPENGENGEGDEVAPDEPAAGDGASAEPSSPA